MPWFGLSNNDNNDTSDDFVGTEEEGVDMIMDDLETGGGSGSGGGFLSSSSTTSLPSIETDNLEPLPAMINPSSNASSSSSNSSSAEAADELAAMITESGINLLHEEEEAAEEAVVGAVVDDEEELITERICFRSLRSGDRKRIQQLHEQWFPVTYSDEFYDELVTNQRLATSGDHLFTCVATLDTHNMYCQPIPEEGGGEGEGSFRPPPPSQQQQQQQQQQQHGGEEQQDNDEIIGCVVGAFLHHSRLNPETSEMLVPNPQVHSKLFYIMTLGTVQEYRNYGVATSLVEQTMDLVQQDPTCGALYLHVIPFNHAAIRFYEKLGFYRVCTIENYYSIDDKQYDCYLYAKYFHGNRGHRTLFKIVSGAISSIWQQLRVPLSIFSTSTTTTSEE